MALDVVAASGAAEAFAGGVSVLSSFRGVPDASPAMEVDGDASSRREAAFGF